MKDHAKGRPLSDTDSNALTTELLQENQCYFVFKRYSNKFQHSLEMSQQIIWTDILQAGTKATPDNSDEEQETELWWKSPMVEESVVFCGMDHAHWVASV